MDHPGRRRAEPDDGNWSLHHPFQNEKTAKLPLCSGSRRRERVGTRGGERQGSRHIVLRAFPPRHLLSASKRQKPNRHLRDEPAGEPNRTDGPRRKGMAGIQGNQRGGPELQEKPLRHMGGRAFGSEHESGNRLLLIFLQELQEFLELTLLVI